MDLVTSYSLMFTDVVWSEAKQSGLIDSMLRNYYIPPIIFGESTSSNGSTHTLTEML